MIDLWTIGMVVGGAVTVLMAWLALSAIWDELKVRRIRRSNLKRYRPSPWN